jgi:hypothetical protein
MAFGTIPDERCYDFVKFAYALSYSHTLSFLQDYHVIKVIISCATGSLFSENVANGCVQ